MSSVRSCRANAIDHFAMKIRAMLGRVEPPTLDFHGPSYDGTGSGALQILFMARFFGVWPKFLVVS
jgi:hypothetical protein